MERYICEQSLCEHYTSDFLVQGDTGDKSSIVLPVEHSEAKKLTVVV